MYLWHDMIHTASRCYGLFTSNSIVRLNMNNITYWQRVWFGYAGGRNAVSCRKPIWGQTWQIRVRDNVCQRVVTITSDQSSVPLRTFTVIAQSNSIDLKFPGLDKEISDVVVTWGISVAYLGKCNYTVHAWPGPWSFLFLRDLDYPRLKYLRFYSAHFTDRKRLACDNLAAVVLWRK